MKCIRPTQFNQNGPLLRCGQCMPCRITRRLEWQTKLMLEYKTWKQACFVTLTYAPEHLPDSEFYTGGNLIKEHLQKFLKRFRRTYQYKYGDRKIRYFAVGEYGEKSERAHYHLVLFNVDPLSADPIITKSWKFGHSRTDEINVNRMKYTLGYTIKKMTNVKDFPDARQPEFNLMSKSPALGHYALPKFATVLRKHNMFPEGALSQMDRYLLKRGPDVGIEYTPFNGWFKSDGQNYKMDRPMLEKLCELVDYNVKNYCELEEPLLLPLGFRVFRNRLTDDSKLDKIEFTLSGGLEDETKKSDKIGRQYKKGRTL